MESAFKPHVDSIVETASAIASREKLKVSLLAISSERNPIQISDDVLDLRFSSSSSAQAGWATVRTFGRDWRQSKAGSELYNRNRRRRPRKSKFSRKMYIRVSHTSYSVDILYRLDRGSKAVSLGSCFYGVRSYVQKRLRKASACSVSYQVSKLSLFGSRQL
jgi:hypothetical protein